jgi:hypothetical protein
MNRAATLGRSAEQNQSAGPEIMHCILRLRLAVVQQRHDFA